MYLLRLSMSSKSPMLQHTKLILWTVTVTAAISRMIHRPQPGRQPPLPPPPVDSYQPGPGQPLAPPLFDGHWPRPE